MLNIVEDLDTQLINFDKLTKDHILDNIEDAVSESAFVWDNPAVSSFMKFSIITNILISKFGEQKAKNELIIERIFVEKDVLKRKAAFLKALLTCFEDKAIWEEEVDSILIGRMKWCFTYYDQFVKQYDWK